MIQRHTLLINLNFSANTGSTAIVSASTLTTIGGYQANNVQGIGGGITNPSNVRGFLNDDRNDLIINDFFSYLTGSTTTIEFAEIYNSDQKLSDVFNDYYISSIVKNQVPSTSVVDNSLIGTSGITIYDNTIYNYDGIATQNGLTGITMGIDNSTRALKTQSLLTTFTSEESYYIPVFIKRNHKEITRLKFTACDKIVNFILNPPCPNPPQNIIATSTANSIFITWPLVDYATSYIVQYSGIIQGPYTTVSVINNNFKLQGLPDGTEFYFKVASVNQNCTSDYSNILEVFTLNLP